MPLPHQRLFNDLLARCTAKIQGEIDRIENTDADFDEKLAAVQVLAHAELDLYSSTLRTELKSCDWTAPGAFDDDANRALVSKMMDPGEAAPGFDRARLTRAPP